MVSIIIAASLIITVWTMISFHYAGQTGFFKYGYRFHNWRERIWKPFILAPFIAVILIALGFMWLNDWVEKKWKL